MQHTGRSARRNCDWWKEHGRILGTSSAIPIRPSLSEWAYLSIAGIVEGISNPEGPIVVIWDHPIVNEHYRKPPGPELKSGPPSTLMASMRPRELTQPSSAHRVQQQASVVTSGEGQDTPEVSTQYRGDLERAVTPSVLLPSVVLQEFEDHHARVQDELRAELERQRLRILELEAERDAQRRRADVAIEENEALKDRLAAREDHLNRIIAVACEPESTIGNKRARRDGGVRIKDEYE
ncbi:hypothetical protein J1614_005822 [Plenodomus biglobosus]|nr:hypothetical protein J1614_005822 [Plenodomus biglobosus]